MLSKLSTFPAEIAGQPIDRRIRRLVGALNQIPGITTCSSCGGHRERDSVCQTSANRFYVSFYVAENRTGWQGLKVVLDATDEISRWLLSDGRIQTIAWFDGGLRWDLKGSGCHPDHLALAIERALDPEWVRVYVDA